MFLVALRIPFLACNLPVKPSAMENMKIPDVFESSSKWFPSDYNSEMESAALEMAKTVNKHLATVRAKIQQLEKLSQLDQKLAEVSRVSEAAHTFARGLEQSDKLRKGKSCGQHIVKITMVLLYCYLEISDTNTLTESLQTRTLHLQRETLQLRQKSLKMQAEYEFVQKSTIRELCRCVEATILLYNF